MAAELVGACRLQITGGSRRATLSATPNLQVPLFPSVLVSHLDTIPICSMRCILNILHFHHPPASPSSSLTQLHRRRFTIHLLSTPYTLQTPHLRRPLSRPEAAAWLDIRQLDTTGGDDPLSNQLPIQQCHCSAYCSTATLFHTFVRGRVPGRFTDQRVFSRPLAQLKDPPVDLPCFLCRTVQFCRDLVVLTSDYHTLTAASWWRAGQNRSHSQPPGTSTVPPNDIEPRHTSLETR